MYFIYDLDGFDSLLSQVTTGPPGEMQKTHKNSKIDVDVKGKETGHKQLKLHQPRIHDKMP